MLNGVFNMCGRVRVLQPLDKFRTPEWAKAIQDFELLKRTSAYL